MKRGLDQYLFALTEVGEKSHIIQSDISIDPLIHQIYDDLGVMAKKHQHIIESFWNSPVDWTDPSLEINHSPFLVT